MTTYEIVFYEKSDGTEPVKDFIMNLLPKMQAKTIRILDILQEFGPDFTHAIFKNVKRWNL